MNEALCVAALARFIRLVLAAGLHLHVANAGASVTAGYAATLDEHRKL
jgi:hypothetical protein